jgi:diguanylate cyclase (GGDEF)-like protein
MLPIKHRGDIALISLRKHIEDHRDPLTESAIAAFRSSLLAMAECGQRAIPPLGEDLNRRLTEIGENLGKPATERINRAAKEVETELSNWAGRAVEQQTEAEREMKEVIAALAKTAESLSARDEKYGREIGGMSGKLQTIAAMNDLGAIRRSIVDSAAALKACVEQMAEEGKKSVSELTAQVTEYKQRLAASERLSRADTLTELANRRAFEGQLQSRIELAKPFGLIVIDLDEFKGVNDRHGHLAGDDLLRQFAHELKAQFTALDLCCRWGGDEFAVLVTGKIEQILERVERIRRWALGEYKIRSGEAVVKVDLKASIGAAEWNGAESGTDLIARADALVYSTKQNSRTAA